MTKFYLSIYPSLGLNMLTRWGRVIGSDNGLQPVRCHTEPMKNQNIVLFIQVNAFENITYKIAVTCPSLNVLTGPLIYQIWVPLASCVGQRDKTLHVQCLHTLSNASLSIIHGEGAGMFTYCDLMPFLCGMWDGGGGALLTWITKS